ncbi:hypothetical protein DEU56DRAFT_844661 [Suillus clintonianus]|uniref:uncharacterized protein n=1 Tax=Suillus clintonianus TaxID=1904413 RepID=UPI001B86DE96|nr:uncharacterized protein DEU56DRAFT_844661 [Suillus clintonianus]KAG2109064.1 hypothetical protein DEU56DRAFT_844661 [Suillus clintonianus]
MFLYLFVLSIDSVGPQFPATLPLPHNLPPLGHSDADSCENVSVLDTPAVNIYTHTFSVSDHTNNAQYPIVCCCSHHLRIPPTRTIDLVCSCSNAYHRCPSRAG